MYYLQVPHILDLKLIPFEFAVEHSTNSCVLTLNIDVLAFYNT
jgi:hypothetical protein